MNSFPNMRTSVASWIILAVFGVLFFIAPWTLSAQSFQPQATSFATPGICSSISYTSFGQFINFFICIIQKYLIPIMMTLAIVLFAFGVSMFILNADNEESRQAGKQFMIWSILAIFVMVSVWGIIQFMGNTVGFNTIIPQLK